MKSNSIEAVQAAFMKAIQQDGIVHTLQWIGDWYDKAAEAALQAELERGLGDLVKNPEAVELKLTEFLVHEANDVSSYSTSAGHNLYRQARVTALASTLQQREREGLGGAVGRRARWMALTANNAAKV